VTAICNVNSGYGESQNDIDIIKWRKRDKERCINLSTINLIIYNIIIEPLEEN